MISKQLKTAAAAGLALLAVGAGAQDAAGDYVSGAFEVTAGNAGHVYALEQIAASGAVSGYPTYETAPAIAATATTATAKARIESLLGFEAKDEMQPYVVLEAQAAGASVVANSKGLITFTLSGAKFASSVRNSDLIAITGEADTQGTFDQVAEAQNVFSVLRKSEGGGVGDGHVTFEMQTDSDSSFFAHNPGSNAAQPDIGDVLVLKLPALKEVSTEGVSVTVSTDSITTNFPVVDTVTRKALKSDGKTLEDKEMPIKAEVLPRAEDAVMASFTPGAAEEIDIESRTALKDGTKTKTLMDVGSLSVTLRADTYQSDGKPFSFSSGGSGFLGVEVSGLDDTDTVFLDTIKNKGGAAMDTGEELSVSGGMADNEFSLSGLPSGSSTLYVMVDGKRILSPGTIKAKAMISLRSGSDLERPYDGSAFSWVVAPAKAKEAKVEVAYAGTVGETLPRAYAIAPAGSGAGDVSNVRVRCDDSSDCQIYLACTDTAGNDVFGKVSAKIAARATMVLRDGGGGDATDLREVFDADAWMSGRLSCDVISAQNVEVQVLTRSGGALVNNTYVSGG